VGTECGLAGAGFIVRMDRVPAAGFIVGMERVLAGAGFIVGMERVLAGAGFIVGMERVPEARTPKGRGCTLAILRTRL